jgi:hypothetical protein
MVPRGVQCNSGFVMSSIQRRLKAPEAMHGRSLGLGNAWRKVVAQLKASTSRFVLKVRRRSHCSGGDCSSQGQVKPPPLRRGDAVVASRGHRQGLCDRICLAAKAQVQSRQAIPCHPVLVGRSQPFSQEIEAFAVTSMLKMPVKRAGQIFGESHSRIFGMLLAQHYGDACAVELLQRGVSEKRRDEPAQRS